MVAAMRVVFSRMPQYQNRFSSRTILSHQRDERGSLQVATAVSKDDYTGGPGGVQAGVVAGANVAVTAGVGVGGGSSTVGGMGNGQMAARAGVSGGARTASGRTPLPTGRRPALVPVSDDDDDDEDSSDDEDISDDSDYHDDEEIRGA
ncbi:hypothetical protein DL98DRAFT_208839 [Cadophora sp. DSE1049]|nr:hypothetical protein DL98DRAFT_208839 [Cadophora sp. DSE1049]